METIQINNKEVLLSKDTNNIKIKELKEYFFTIKNTNLEEIDRQILQMNILTGLSTDELEELDLDDYKALAIKTYSVFNTDLDTQLITVFNHGDLMYGVRTKDNGDVKITIKDITLIKNKIISSVVDTDKEVQFMSNLNVLAAILFRPIVNGVIVDSLDDNSIQSRAAIFDTEMSINIIYPYINKIIDKIK